MAGSRRSVTLAALAIGAVSGWAVDELARRRLPTRRGDLAAAGLVTAAVIYPAARRGHRGSRPAVHELGGVLAAAALGGAARARGKDRPDALRYRELVAAGWVAHALFDAVHHAGPGGRLPRWYPALCAGYDVAQAAALLRGSSRRP